METFSLNRGDFLEKSHNSKSKRGNYTKKNEKLCTFLREKILKVPEKKYKLKNSRQNLKKVPKKQPEKEKKNLF